MDLKGAKVRRAKCNEDNANEVKMNMVCIFWDIFCRSLIFIEEFLGFQDLDASGRVLAQQLVETPCSMVVGFRPRFLKCTTYS